MNVVTGHGRSGENPSEAVLRRTRASPQAHTENGGPPTSGRPPFRVPCWPPVPRAVAPVRWPGASSAMTVVGRLRTAETAGSDGDDVVVVAGRWAIGDESPVASVARAGSSCTEQVGRRGARKPTVTSRPQHPARRSGRACPPGPKSVRAFGAHRRRSLRPISPFTESRDRSDAFGAQSVRRVTRPALRHRRWAIRRPSEDGLEGDEPSASATPTPWSRRAFREETLYQQ